MINSEQITLADTKMNPQAGLGVIEVLVAVAVLIVGVVSTTLMYVDGMGASNAALEQSRAIFLAHEGLEAFRSILAADSDAISGCPDCYVELTAGIWELQEGTGPTLLDQFERSLTITEGQLDGWQVEVTVSWPHPITGSEQSVSKVSNFTEF